MDHEAARGILASIEYPEYTLAATIDGRGEMYLQGAYNEADILTGKMAVQLTRRWFISPEMSRSELVQTAFKCVITSMEHRVREHFKYRGQLVFGPHFDVEELVKLARAGALAMRDVR